MPTTWHGEIGFKLAGFWSFLALDVGLALIMTWIYLSSNRSVLSGMLLHFTSNFTAQLVAPASDRYQVFVSLLVLVTGLVACLQMTRETRRQPRFDGSDLSARSRQVLC